MCFNSEIRLMKSSFRHTFIKYSSLILILMKNILIPNVNNLSLRPYLQVIL